MADNFRQFQDLIKKIADTPQISLKEVKDLQHRLLDILQSATPSRLTLPISEALLDLSKMVWQTPATILPTCKRVDKKCYVPPKNLDFLFSHPLINLVVVDKVNEW